MKKIIFTKKNGIVYDYKITTNKKQLMITSNYTMLDIINNQFGNAAAYSGNNADAGKFYVKNTGIIYIEKI